MAGAPSVRDPSAPGCLEKPGTPLGSRSTWGLIVASLGWSIRDFGKGVGVGSGVWRLVGAAWKWNSCLVAGCGPYRSGYPVTWNTMSQEDGIGDTVQSPKVHGLPVYHGIFSLKAVLECFNCFARERLPGRTGHPSVCRSLGVLVPRGALDHSGSKSVRGLRVTHQFKAATSEQLGVGRQPLQWKLCSRRPVWAPQDWRPGRPRTADGVLMHRLHNSGYPATGSWAKSGGARF